MSFDVTIDTSGLEALASRLDNAGAIVDAEIENTMVASTSAIEGAIKPRTPVGATGDLRRSLTNTVDRPAEGEWMGSVLFEAPYAPYVESGRAPGQMPPPSALEYWAVRAGAVLPGETSRQAGWRLAKSIAKKGTKAAKMVEHGWREARSYVEDAWRGIGDRIAERMERELQ